MCSPAKERQRRALQVNSRVRRTIYVPPKTHWQCKWSLNLPFDTQHRYFAKVQFSIPININFPGWLFDNYGFEKLTGEYYDDYSPYGGGGGLDRNDQIPYDSAGGFDRNDQIPYDSAGLRHVPVLHKRSVDGNEEAYNLATQKERMYIYRHFEGFFEKLSLPGVDCLQRTICEVAEEPIDDGLVGEWFNLILTPSAAVKAATTMDDLKPYLAAEKVGDRQRACDLQYSSCPASMFRLMPLLAKAMFTESQLFQ